MNRVLSCLVVVLFGVFFSSFGMNECHIFKSKISGHIYFSNCHVDSTDKIEVLGTSENSPQDLIDDFGDMSYANFKGLYDQFTKAFLHYASGSIGYGTYDDIPRIEVSGKEWYDGNIFEINHAYPLMVYYIFFNGKKFVYEANERSTIAVDCERSNLIKLWLAFIFAFYLTVGIFWKRFSSLRDKKIKSITWYCLCIFYALMCLSTAHYAIGWSMESLESIVKSLIAAIGIGIVLSFFGRSLSSIIALNVVPALFVWSILGIGNMMIFLGISIAVSANGIILHNEIKKVFKKMEEKKLQQKQQADCK